MLFLRTANKFCWLFSHLISWSKLWPPTRRLSFCFGLFVCWFAWKKDYYGWIFTKSFVTYLLRILARLFGVSPLGTCVYFVSSKSLECSLSNFKRSFYRSFNAIFGKVGRLAAELVTVELLKSKCLPSLYYGLEACPLSSADFKSLEYVVVGAFMKIFNTRSRSCDQLHGNVWFFAAFGVHK